MYNDTVATLRACGQSHVADALDERTSTLDAAQRAALHAQLTGFSMDVAQLCRVLDDSLAALHTVATTTSTTTAAAQRMRPPRNVFATATTTGSLRDRALAACMRRCGYALVRRGGGAVVLLAGGSGTRLGARVPKGTMTLDHLPSRSTLFDMHCARIARVQALAAAADDGAAGAVPPIPLFVMTSRETDAATRAYFASHAYCGLLPSQVHFFVQGSLPCFDAATRTLCFAAPGELCTAPAGNGDVYRSLATARDSHDASRTCLQVLRDLGVTQVQLHNVDNLLARVADPLLFGCPAVTGAQVVVKAVPKRSPDEAVGVFALVDGHFGVVEYTELGAWRAAQAASASHDDAPCTTRKRQSVQYNYANIGAQQCSVELIALAAARMTTQPRYHAAIKAMQTHDGRTQAARLEAFIFDAFRYCSELPHAPRTDAAACDGALPAPRKYAVLLVRRDEEFAPIKNADSSAHDTPATAARALLALHSRWCVRALANTHGATHDDNTTRALRLLHTRAVRIELSPHCSYAGEDVDALRVRIVAAVTTQRTKECKHMYIAKL